MLYAPSANSLLPPLNLSDNSYTSTLDALNWLHIWLVHIADNSVSPAEDLSQLLNELQQAPLVFNKTADLAPLNKLTPIGLYVAPSSAKASQYAGSASFPPHLEDNTLLGLQANDGTCHWLILDHLPRTLDSATDVHLFVACDKGLVPFPDHSSVVLPFPPGLIRPVFAGDHPLAVPHIPKEVMEMEDGISRTRQVDVPLSLTTQLLRDPFLTKFLPLSVVEALKTQPLSFRGCVRRLNQRERAEAGDYSLLWTIYLNANSDCRLHFAGNMPLSSPKTPFEISSLVLTFLYRYAQTLALNQVCTSMGYPSKISLLGFLDCEQFSVSTSITRPNQVDIYLSAPASQPLTRNSFRSTWISADPNHKTPENEGGHLSSLLLQVRQFLAAHVCTQLRC